PALAKKGRPGWDAPFLKRLSAWSPLRSLGGRRFHRFDGLGLADRDGARLLGLGNLAHQVDVQEAVLADRPGHDDMVGELEATLEGAGCDALVEHVALLVLLGLLRSAYGQRVLAGLDRELALAEAGDREGDPVGVLAGPLDVI